MSVPCPACNKSVLIEDVVVSSYKGVLSVETCGKLIIRRRGRVVAQHRVVAHEGIEVEGELDCRQVLSGGLVRLGAKAEWRGDLRAPALAVAAGAKIRASHFRVPDDPLDDLRRLAAQDEPAAPRA